MADSDNVIIMGAGSSCDAGIPLMDDFVQTMWEIAIRGSIKGESISDEDREIFREAMEIKDTLDVYHGRALFDDRNLEDILSILSFNDMKIEGNGKKQLRAFVRAISKTIELTCRIKAQPNRTIPDGPEMNYTRFWKYLFSWYESESRFPTIITFNYDLVLERSLWRILNGPILKKTEVPFSSINVRYFHKYHDQNLFNVKFAEYDTVKDDNKYGICLESGEGENPLPIEILKLHGSLNFPTSKSDDLSLVKPQDEPLILPPIINKMSAAEEINEVWIQAMDRLRNAKNVIIVGYSLPQTDIYMQYFIKTALGPNKNLNRIYVFDPVLFQDDQRANTMIERYESCFSPQLQSRIVFKPSTSWHSPSGEFPTQNDYIREQGGKFRHFVDMLKTEDGILF